MDMLVIYLYNISIDSSYFGLPTAFSNRAETNLSLEYMHSILNEPRKRGKASSNFIQKI